MSFMLSGFRAVTITRSPFVSAAKAISRPKPVEQPLINHTLLALALALIIPPYSFY